MIYFILICMGGALLLYTLLGGADFGAGILEIFVREAQEERRQERISKAMGPVWEANHVWLILAIVILFVGFPDAFAEISVHFHIPLSFLLVGIVLRGSAFIFRYYDAPHAQIVRVYSIVFHLSSVWSSFWIGVIAGGVMQGVSEKGYLTWVTPFCFCMGFFVIVLHCFLAAVYLIGEAKAQEEKRFFSRFAKRANIALVLTGTLIFIVGEFSPLALASTFFRNKLSLACFFTATVSLVPLWFSIMKGWARSARFIAASEGALVLLGWYAIQYPYLVKPLTVHDSVAPVETMRALTIVLVFGGLLVLPAFFYLLYVFKFHHERQA